MQDGQRVVQVVQTVVVTVPVSKIIKLSLGAEGVQVYGTDGKKLDPKEVQKLAAKPVAALASTDGKPVDPFYLRLARAGTLVLVFPPSAADAPDQPKGERLIPSKPVKE